MSHHCSQIITFISCRHLTCLNLTGGGQLGRMLATSASLLNIDLVILDVGELAPAKQIIAPRSPALTHIDGSFADPEKIKQLARKVDVITVEIEHVDVTVLKEIESTPGTRAVIHPSPSTIAVIQDKLEQKTYLRANGCPVSEFVKVDPTIESIKATAAQFGLPFMLKSRTLAYDGRGNFVVRTLDEAENALQALSNRPLYAEKWVPFIKEIAVMVVRTTDGDVVSYPAVETIHKDNICHLVFAPLRNRDPLVASHAQRVAESAVRTFQGAGVFGVEMFLMEDGTYASWHSCLPSHALLFTAPSPQGQCTSTKSPLVLTTRGTTPSKPAMLPNTRTTSAPSSGCPSEAPPSKSPPPQCSTSSAAPPPWTLSIPLRAPRSLSPAALSTYMVNPSAGLAEKWGTSRSSQTLMPTCARASAPSYPPSPSPAHRQKSTRMRHPLQSQAAATRVPTRS